MTHVPVHTGCDGEVPGPGASDRDAPCVCNRRTYQGCTGAETEAQGAPLPGLYQFGRPVFLLTGSGLPGELQRGGDGGSRVTTTNFIPACQGQMLHIRGLDLFSAAPNGEKNMAESIFYDENRQFWRKSIPTPFLRW